MKKQDKDRSLLAQSIAHWEKELAKLENDRPHKVTIGALSCALCLEYIELDCTGCPIKAYTGIKQCRKTPYDKACSALFRLLNRKNTENKKGAIDSFQKEIDFLEALLNELSD